MKTFQRCAALLVVVCAQVVQGQTLELRLEASTTAKLPGLPVQLRVVAVNRAATEQRLPITMWIHASRGDAQRFIGSEYTTWLQKVPQDQSGVADSRLPIAPGATVTAELGVSGTCESPVPLLDPFLFEAGRYTLRAVTASDENAMRDAVRSGSLSEIVQSVPGVVVSLPLTIDIVAPQGVDAEAWRMFLERFEGRAWNDSGLEDRRHQLARQLLSRFPTSSYTYCFGVGYLHDESLASLETLASNMREASLQPPMLDWLELIIAGWHRTQCSKFLDLPGRNVGAAIAECDLARAELEKIADTTNPLVRQKTQAMHPMTEVEIRNYVLHREAVETGTYHRIIPVLQCVKETGKGLEAVFGYRNDNAFVVNGPVGVRNFFAPEPEDRGQPLKFLPGVHNDAVTVTVTRKKNDPQRTISWTVEETTVTAPADSAPRCKAK